MVNLFSPRLQWPQNLPSAEQELDLRKKSNTAEDIFKTYVNTVWGLVYSVICYLTVKTCLPLRSEDGLDK